MEENLYHISASSRKYAPIWKRFLALIIDIIIVAVIDNFFKKILHIDTELKLITFDLNSVKNLMSYLLIMTVLRWLYFALMESSANQATFGKLAMKIKVTDYNSRQISFARATARHFSKIISVVILFYGYFMAMWDERNQTLHDKISNTYVVEIDV